MSKLTHYIIFKSLFTKEEYTDEEIKKYFSPFLAGRQLMSSEDYVFLVNNINALQLDKVMHYNVLKMSLPRTGQAPFLKFIGQKKKNGELIKKIAEYYKCSYGTAEDYLIFINNTPKLKEEIEYKWFEKRGELNQFFKKRKK